MTDTGHNRSIVVWDVPTAVPCGDVFSFKVGIKCLAECPPAGWLLEIRDHEDVPVAAQAVSVEPWHGTAALFHAEFNLRSPAEEGLFVWQAISPASERGQGDDEPFHDAAAANFSVRSVRAQECRLKVVAIDRAAQKPVPGMKVVAHPYRTTTDEHGVAELHLPRGQYRLFVSGKDYFPLRLDGELKADQEIHAELEVDRGPTDAQLWS